LSLHQRSFAHHVRLCPRCRNGILCASGLRRHRLVSISDFRCPVPSVHASNRLISASVGTVAYYGFQCRPDLCKCFLLCCFLMGLAGNVVPFMSWFNEYRYRVSCIARPDDLVLNGAHRDGGFYSSCVLPSWVWHLSRP
jgi:hypothetical protein